MYPSTIGSTHQLHIAPSTTVIATDDMTAGKHLILSKLESLQAEFSQAIQSILAQKKCPLASHSAGSSVEDTDAYSFPEAQQCEKENPEKKAFLKVTQLFHWRLVCGDDSCSPDIIYRSPAGWALIWDRVMLAFRHRSWPHMAL